MIPENIQKKLEILAERLLSQDFIKIITHYDCDGIAAAGILAKALLRTDRSFHVTFLTSPDTNSILEIVEEDPGDLCVIMDMGSTAISELNNYEDRVIIIDHHIPEISEDKDFLLNPHIFGIDGTKHACTSTLSFLLSINMGENADLGAFFICGALADKQDLFGGLNRTALELTPNVKVTNSLALDSEKVIDSLYYLTEPYVEDLSGNLDKIKDFLRYLKIDENKSIAELSRKDMEKIATSVIFRLLRRGIPPKYAQKIIRKSFLVGEKNLNLLSDYLDYTGKSERMGLALLYILKNDEEFLEEMKEIYRLYKDSLLKELENVRNYSKKIGNIVYYGVSDRKMTSTVATIASRYIYPNHTFVAAHDDGKFTKLSIRKLDEKTKLGEIIRDLSKKYGGYGGGHSSSAGAHIPSSNLESFLNDLSSLL